MKLYTKHPTEEVADNESRNTQKATEVVNENVSETAPSSSILKMVQDRDNDGSKKNKLAYLEIEKREAKENADWRGISL